MSEALTNVVRAVIEECSDLGIVEPVVIANKAFKELDRLLKDEAAILELRQIARELLRGKYAAHRKGKDDEPFLFEGLQDRYPKAGGQGYVKRELMTDEDVQYNLGRMDSEIAGKQAHRNALVKWWNSTHDGRAVG